MSPSRSILLVGEGNFSFSASLCQSLSGSDSSVVASCLQKEDEALRHEGAASNIKSIRGAGGTVLFDTDCRKLGESTFLKGYLFDLVIFNFPHCGRKSGVKKNRELLKNFFLSCVQVLSEDGEVHVSLCNGQGGTPVDHPKREWHNSWQVAAMAAEAHLVLTDVQPFESDKYHSYKCTGYRSQDKGFHVENALLHVFTRSLPYKSPEKLTVEETVGGEKVQYQIPAELSDYVFRKFLDSGSTHPVKIVQDFIVEGLSEYCSVSMTTETIPFLLSGKQVQKYGRKMDRTQCYLIHLLPKDCSCESHPSVDKSKCAMLRSYSWTEKNDEGNSMSTRSTVSQENMDKARCKGGESLKPARSLDDDPEIETELYFLRPSLTVQLKDLMKHKPLPSDCKEEAKSEASETLADVEEHHCVSNGSVCPLLGISGVVFRNVPINTWALPVFHELLLTGAFPSEPDPLKMFGQHFEKLFTSHGALLKSEQGELHLVVQPMGLIGKVFANKKGDNLINIHISLNLDLLAVLLFAIPDWRLLWSYDSRFDKQFSIQPSLETRFCPFSLFPEHFKFDISFWTGSTWDERKFYGVVREVSCGTVQQVKRIDTFSHPDLSQTSFCYRLVYHSHTHALSHSQALLFHKRLESALSAWLQVTIR